MARKRFSDFLLVGLAIFAGLFVFSRPLPSQSVSLPLPQVHPLPPTLASWRDEENRGDYFEALEKGEVGALVWSRFPVTVAIQADRPEWVALVRQAIAEWNLYLSLAFVEGPEADIVVKRELPPSGVRFNPETRQLEIPRVRSATTQYEVFVKDNFVHHRMLVRISPKVSDASALAAIRHELGHALGIWGHSPAETDVMYFSQTREIPSISRRDVNTLKKVYQQATRLGWEVREVD
jgi:predicted Zn-dependent protease